MTSPDHRPRLRRATREAQARRDRSRAELERRTGPPRPGDLLGFAETAEHSVLWAILEADPAGEFPRRGTSGKFPRRGTNGGFLAVAADLHPFAGSSDVAVPAESACGALCLRCGFEVRLDAAACGAAKQVGVLEPEVLDRARRKRAEIEAGAVTGSVLERDTDGEPDYQDWLEDGPAKAQAALVASLDRRGAAGADHDDRIYVGGVDAVTGGYLVAAMHASQAAAWVRRERVDPGILSLLRHVHRTGSRPHLGLPAGMDPREVSQAGWAVVFHASESRAVKDALRPLIEHRRAREGAAKTRVLEYRPGEEWRQWLSRHGVAAGRVQPAKVPYYLLLVGSPARIPYDFQQQLGVEYAVGRLGLETAVEVRRYAESVVDHETRTHAVQDKAAVFFGPRHDFDPATRWSADELVKPLMDGLPAVAEEPARPGVAESRGFRTHRLWGEAATKANLKAAFHPPGGKPPALVFAAAHGLGWPADHPRQLAAQGALLCQDWPALGDVDPDRHCFFATDLGGAARVRGTVVFLHAAYSAGTPERPVASPESAEPPPRIAREPFVASLPRRLLAHPQGGAAAVIGLVGRAWACPLAPSAVGPQAPFRAALDGMLAGWPVGHAVRELKKRYAALSTQLEALRQKMAMGANLDQAEVAALWSERNVTRGIVVAGDPAVRVRVDGMD